MLIINVIFPFSRHIRCTTINNNNSSNNNYCSFSNSNNNNHTPSVIFLPD